MRDTLVRWVVARAVLRVVIAILPLVLFCYPVVVHSQQSTMLYDIRAQPLSEALMAFGARTGAIVMASSALTAGKTSRPVLGQLTFNEALTRMLYGTGLKFEVSANGTVLIVRLSPLAR